MQIKFPAVKAGLEAMEAVTEEGLNINATVSFTVPQALEIVRGCRGMDLVGADLVEVSPPYDNSGNTSLLAANLLFEMLCVLPGVRYRG